MYAMVHLLHKIIGDDDGQVYQGHHWTTEEINAGKIKELTAQRQAKQIPLLRYLYERYFVYKLYIPKDKTKWGD